MNEQPNVQTLQKRIAELEAQNRELRQTAGDAPEPSGSRPGRGRSILAAVLIIVSVLAAPVAVIGTWARVQLVDTDRFVQTFAPLAEEPAVQTFLTDQVVEGIDQSVDIDALVGDLFTGLTDLDLPPRAVAALPLLQGPAAEGMHSLIRTGVEKVVASPRFAQLWEVTLRQAHSRAVAIIQGDPNTALQLSADGTLSLELDVVIREVKETLVSQGFGIAERIPEIDRSIPIVASDSLVLIRTVYQIAVSAGYWLPWVLLAMLGIGIAVARRRATALAWTGAGLAASFALLGAGLGTGRQFFIGTVSPSIMPRGTAAVLFDQLTALISSTIVALVVLSIFIAVGAWLASGGRAATAARGTVGSGFAAIRATADRHGLGTRAFGAFIERWRSTIIVAAVAIGVFVLFLNRPVTTGGVFATLASVVAVLIIVELVRRPAQPTVAVSEADQVPGRP
ncbi:MAG: hypothetical protein ACK5LO_01210 [Leucobacter sp.]